MTGITWRDSARRRIDEVLAALPSDTPLDGCRAALSRAYPFGKRACYPYKAWLAECRAAIAARFPDADIRTCRPRIVAVPCDGTGLSGLFADEGRVL